ncbi:acyltransferase family protein [Paenibacillus sp. URB8-2]|uniref:acyltransferase family protein n=1 Tax=Paenibacillus sp. URB8-2 TaxID=2741301 RepID=UPI0015BEA513|nr:acyltransferase [Paenibacillus sp. URB8-2]BCG57408.1 hypothetical protein PUR_08330 [Paenibacillus sp. URB8-2]
MRRYYPGITIFKLAGSLIVLIAHVMLFRYFGEMPNGQMNYIFNAMKVIVPCFYMISGFLAYRGWSGAENPAAYVRKYLTRILVVYGFFCLIFAGEFVVPALIRGGLTASNLFLQAKIMAAMFLLNGPFIQLWFIPPLMFGMLLAYFLFRRTSLRAAAVLTLLGFLLAQTLFGTLRAILDAITGGIPFLDTDYGGYLELFAERYLGYGLTFVTAGAFIAKYEERFLRLGARFFLVPAAVLTLIETLLLMLGAKWTPDYSLAFCMIPNTVLFFYGVLRIKSRSIQAYHSTINLFSMVTFFGHIPFIQINLLLLKWDVARLEITRGWIVLLITLLECLAGTLILALSKRQAAWSRQRDPYS